MSNNKHIFDMEITTYCNKECYTCPRQEFTRKKREMSWEVFEKVCDWLPEGCDVFFAGYGEPLLHKNHLDFIGKLTEKKIRTSIITNGKLLSHEKICELYEVGLYKLQISILLRNEEGKIEKFIDMIDKKYYGKTQFNLIYDETKPLSLSDNLEKRGFKVESNRVHSRGGNLYQLEKPDLSSCATFFKVTYIDTNGDLQICSNDINGKYNLGNISTLKFEELMEIKNSYSKDGIIAPVCEHCDDEYRRNSL